MTSAITAQITGMIFEDNEFQRHLIRGCINNAFGKGVCETQEAEDGKAGLKICDKVFFNFYIVDYWMPQMNGVQVCQSILEKYPEAHLILFTDNPIDELITKHTRSVVESLTYIHKTNIRGLTEHLKGLKLATLNTRSSL